MTGQSRRSTITPSPLLFTFCPGGAVGSLFSQPRNYVASWSLRDAVCSGGNEILARRDSNERGRARMLEREGKEERERERER